jgi:hypothetical protein
MELPRVRSVAVIGADALPVRRGQHPDTRQKSDECRRSRHGRAVRRPGVPPLGGEYLEYLEQAWVEEYDSGTRPGRLDCDVAVPPAAEGEP